MNYENVITLCEKCGYVTGELPFLQNDGMMYKNCLAVRDSIPTKAEKSQVLAEELAHGILTVGDITDQKITANRKQEKKARRLSHRIKQIDPDGIIECYRSGCRNAYEMAEYFECTESFLKEALNNLHEMYGTCVKRGQYALIFDPHLAVVKQYSVKEGIK